MNHSCVSFVKELLNPNLNDPLPQLGQFFH